MFGLFAASARAAANGSSHLKSAPSLLQPGRTFKLEVDLSNLPKEDNTFGVFASVDNTASMKAGGRSWQTMKAVEFLQRKYKKLSVALWGTHARILDTGFTPLDKLDCSDRSTYFVTMIESMRIQILQDRSGNKNAVFLMMTDGDAHDHAQAAERFKDEVLDMLCDKYKKVEIVIVGIGPDHDDRKMQEIFQSFKEFSGDGQLSYFRVPDMVIRSSLAYAPRSLHHLERQELERMPESQKMKEVTERVLQETEDGFSNTLGCLVDGRKAISAVMDGDRAVVTFGPGAKVVWIKQGLYEETFSLKNYVPVEVNGVELSKWHLDEALDAAGKLAPLLTLPGCNAHDVKKQAVVLIDLCASLIKKCTTTRKEELWQVRAMIARELFADPHNLGLRARLRAVRKELSTCQEETPELRQKAEKLSSMLKMIVQQADHMIKGTLSEEFRRDFKEAALSRHWTPKSVAKAEKRSLQQYAPGQVQAAQDACDKFEPSEECKAAEEDENAQRCFVTLLTRLELAQEQGNFLVYVASLLDSNIAQFPLNPCETFDPLDATVCHQPISFKDFFHNQGKPFRGPGINNLNRVFGFASMPPEVARIAAKWLPVIASLIGTGKPYFLSPGVGSMLVLLKALLAVALLPKTESSGQVVRDMLIGLSQVARETKLFPHARGTRDPLVASPKTDGLSVLLTMFGDGPFTSAVFSDKFQPMCIWALFEAGNVPLLPMTRVSVMRGQLLFAIRSHFQHVFTFAGVPPRAGDRDAMAAFSKKQCDRREQGEKVLHFLVGRAGDDVTDAEAAKLLRALERRFVPPNDRGQAPKEWDDEAPADDFFEQSVPKPGNELDEPIHDFIDGLPLPDFSGVTPANVPLAAEQVNLLLQLLSNLLEDLLNVHAHVFGIDSKERDFAARLAAMLEVPLEGVVRFLRDQTVLALSMLSNADCKAGAALPTDYFVAKVIKTAADKERQAQAKRAKAAAASAASAGAAARRAARIAGGHLHAPLVLPDWSKLDPRTHKIVEREDECKKDHGIAGCNFCLFPDCPRFMLKKEDLRRCFNMNGQGAGRLPYYVKDFHKVMNRLMREDNRDLAAVMAGMQKHCSEQEWPLQHKSIVDTWGMILLCELTKPPCSLKWEDAFTRLKNLSPEEEHDALKGLKFAFDIYTGAAPLRPHTVPPPPPKLKDVIDCTITIAPQFAQLENLPQVVAKVLALMYAKEARKIQESITYVQLIADLKAAGCKDLNLWNLVMPTPDECKGVTKEDRAAVRKAGGGKPEEAAAAPGAAPGDAPGAPRRAAQSAAAE